MREYRKQTTTRWEMLERENKRSFSPTMIIEVRVHED